MFRFFLIHQNFGILNFWNFICLHFLKLMKTSSDFFLANHTKQPDGLCGEVGYCSYFVGETFSVQKKQIVHAFNPKLLLRAILCRFAIFYLVFIN